MASGYARCDWESLFEAASSAPWDLVVVCGRHDLERVHALNRTVHAEVHCDIPREAHAAMLAEANVYVIPVREEEVSTGHVRLRDANEHGVPVVAADIRAMGEYLLNGRTGLTYLPGDASDLRRAVQKLLDDPTLAAQLAASAVERSARWDQVHVFLAQRALIDVLLGHAPEPGLEHPPIDDAINQASIDPPPFLPVDSPRRERAQAGTQG